MIVAFIYKEIRVDPHFRTSLSLYSALSCQRLVVPLLAIVHGPDKPDQAFPDLSFGADARLCKDQILVGPGSKKKPGNRPGCKVWGGWLEPYARVAQMVELLLGCLSRERNRFAGLDNRALVIALRVEFLGLLATLFCLRYFRHVAAGTLLHLADQRLTRCHQIRAVISQYRRATQPKNESARENGKDVFFHLFSSAVVFIRICNVSTSSIHVNRICIVYNQ